MDNPKVLHSHTVYMAQHPLSLSASSQVVYYEIKKPLLPVAPGMATITAPPLIAICRDPPLSAW